MSDPKPDRYLLQVSVRRAAASQRRQAIIALFGCAFITTVASIVGWFIGTWIIPLVALFVATVGLGYYAADSFRRARKNEQYADTLDQD